MKLETGKVYCGDYLKLMKELPDESIDCIITSPPYWAIRDYGVKGQIGLEEHPQQYIDKIVELMREAKRVLKPTGTVFLNLGDSFYTRSGGYANRFSGKCEELKENKNLFRAYTQIRGKFKTSWLQQKQKLLIPYRIAIKCQDELGLILRNDIHWIKQFSNVKTGESYGSSIPNPVRDRLNMNSESIYFFVKSKKYLFDLDQIRIKYKTSSIRRYNSPLSQSKASPYSKQWGIRNPRRIFNPLGKNPGDCLHFPFEPSKEKHFAMFPSSIPEFFIRCGSPKNGIVLDPFVGSGTTALAAIKLKRKFIGFDLNPNYCRLAERRIKQFTGGLNE